MISALNVIDLIAIKYYDAPSQFAVTGTNEEHRNPSTFVQLTLTMVLLYID